MQHTYKGSPVVLMGHINPDLSIASLFGIHMLTEARCKMTFTKMQCVVRYHGKVVLIGEKDPATELWMLPLGSPDMTSQHVFNDAPSAAPVDTDAHARLATQIAF